MFAGSLLIPPPQLAGDTQKKHRLFEKKKKKMEAKRSYTKAALAFSIASLLIGVFAVLDACLSPVTWQHCHGDRGLSNHLCNDPYSPEGRRRDGGAEGGGGSNESRASKSRGREGGGGSSRAEQQDPDRNKKKTDFLSTGSRERSFYVLYNEHNSLKKLQRKCDSGADNGCRINAGGEKGRCGQQREIEKGQERDKDSKRADVQWSSHPTVWSWG